MKELKRLIELAERIENTDERLPDAVWVELGEAAFEARSKLKAALQALSATSEPPPKPEEIPSLEEMRQLFASASPSAGGEAEAAARDLMNGLYNAKRCPNPYCGDTGSYPEGDTDNPEQVQCEFCYTVEDSLFNVIQSIPQRHLGRGK